MSRPTEAELEALRMRADGWSNPEIADVLHVSLNAVKQRLRRARERLGAADTAHTLAECYRRGLLEVVPDGS
jgi:DNA-binding CsgD family transcriptional regulator